MALNPSSANQPKGQTPRASGTGEKPARVSSPPAIGAVGGAPSGPASAAPANSGLGPSDPKQIGKYEVQKKLGSGGMGTVYLALDTQLKRQVALKLLPKEKADNPNLVKRFHAEAQSAANLRHENIVTVYEAGEADGYLFMALEFVDGVDTAELVARRGVIPVKRSIEIIKQILKALDHAFSKKIVHRDIKPANLMIRRDGLVKLTDLGLARSREDPLESGITRAGTTVGTIDYMPPEQARDSKAADVRSDLYALGCTWYYLLTGEAPYPEGNMTNKLRAHSETPFPDPRLKNQGVPEGVVAVMRRMTEKDPRRRYQTPAEVLADLDQSNSNTARAMAPEMALGDLARDEGEAIASGTRRAPRSSTGSPPVHVPPSPNEKLKLPPRQDDERSEERDYRWVFYGGLALGAVALIGGVGWVVQTFSHTFDAPRHVDIANPLAGRKALPRDDGNPAPPNNPGANASRPPEQVPPEHKSDPVPLAKPKTPTQVVRTEGPPPEPPSDVPKTLEPPKWLAEPPAPPSILIRVRANPRATTEAATVHDAVARIPAGGGVIELMGAGPFLFRPVEAIDKTRIVIQGGEGSQVPLVLLLPGEGAAADRPILNLRGTHLELRGVQFAASGGLFRTAPEALICVRNGDLLVERCTFTASGTSSSPPLTALKVSGEQGRGATAGEPAHLLIHETLFRGPRLTALATEVSHADVVIRNSFAWAGTAPALHLEAPGRNLAAGAQLKASLFHSTLVSQTCGVELSRSPTDVPLQNPVAIGLLESVIATPGLGGAATPTTKGSAVLCSLSGWNKANTRGICGKNLSWQSVRSLYLGWDRLLDAPPEGGVSAANFAEWRGLFVSQRQPLGETAQFQTARWPAQLPDDPSRLVPASLSFDTLGEPFVKSATGGWPGATPGSLVANDPTDALTAAADLPVRTPFPEAYFTRGESFTAHIDLMKEDLGKAISEMRLQNGMTIVASGNNRHLCMPIVIDGVWIRLRFQQTEGPPLILTPRGPALRGLSWTGPSDDALITVRNGGLELSRAVFDAPIDDRKQLPRWYVQGVNSDLVLRNCRIEGPMTTGTANLGIVQWLRTGPGTPVRPAELPRDADAYLVLHESYLSGSGSVIQADTSRRRVFARNSVAVARDTLFDLRSGGSDAGDGGVVDCERCTFSSAGPIFRIDGTVIPLDTAAPLRMFADRCVFAPPVKIGERAIGSTLLSSPAPLITRKQILWGEAYNGYASDITRFLHSTEKAGVSGSLLGSHDWEKKWGPLRVVSPLLSRDGVKLAEPLPDRRKLEPASFRLQRTCEATSWAPYGNLIGADVRAMNVPETRSAKSTSTGSSGGSKGSGSKTTPSQPTKGVPPRTEKGF